jgi:cytochrome b561
VIAQEGNVRAGSYDTAGKVLHWAVLALVACQFVTALLLPDIKLDTTLDTAINLHFNFGLAIVALMAVRLVHRLRRPVTVAPGDSPSRERTLALSTHRLFYTILLVGPFLGWVAASAHSVPVRIFGLVTLPALAPRKAEWGFVAGDMSWSSFFGRPNKGSCELQWAAACCCS